MISVQELARTQCTRKSLPIALLLLPGLIYAAIFAFVWRHYAYAEPGGFPAFYTSGKLARFDVRGLYNRHLQDVFHPGNLGTGYFFHLPYELILLVPLSYFSQVTAYIIWVALNLAALLGAAYILRQHFQSFSPLMPFAFAPTLSLLLNGQDIGIITLLVVMAFDRFARGKDAHAGALMALGLFKFPLVIPLSVFLALRHRRVFAGFVAGSLPLLLSSVFIVGKQGVYDYLALTSSTDAREDPAILVNLRGAISEIMGSQTWLVIALSFLCILVFLRIRSARVPTFCIAIIATMLVSWHAHLYDTVLLLIPMGWMLESELKWMNWASIALLLGTAPILISYAHAYLLGIFLMVLLWPLVWHNHSALSQTPTAG